MDDESLFLITMIVLVLGLLLLVAVVWAGFRMFTRQLEREFPSIVFDATPGVGYPRLVVDLITDYRERKNEFWTIYGQVIIAILIAVMLTVLLLTKTISAEAGLPILSAIAGFAIAKGISSSRRGPSDGTSDDRRPPKEGAASLR